MGERVEGEGVARKLGELRREPIAGFISAVVAIPDGLASAAMVGVNPIYGLYTAVIAPSVGSLFLSTQRMMIATTSASALAAAEALSDYPPDQRGDALMLLVGMIGAMLAVMGLLGAGRLMRFVSHAVMTGFLLGVAVTLILDQLPQLLGFSTPEGSALRQMLTLPGKLGEIVPHIAIIGVCALAILLVLGRTRWSNWAPLVALVVPTLLVLVLGWNDVPDVGSRSAGGMGLPVFRVPDVSLFTVNLAISAAAIAAIIAIQAAGVSEGVPNLDRTESNVSRDMVAQGAANLAGSVFSAIPAGGSVGQSALNASLGARSRWAGFSAGLWMLAFIALIPGLVALVPMSVLAALMVMAGIGAFNGREALWVWRSAGGARWAILATFVASLLTSIPNAVGIGVLVTIIYFVSSSATDISLNMLVRDEQGRVCEVEPPKVLPDHKVTVLDVHGSLFFAGARTLSDKMPDGRNSSEASVVLRLRGYTPAGSTLIDVLDDYADELAENGGALYLSGVGDELAEQLTNSGKLDIGSGVHLFKASPAIGASTNAALDEALKLYEER